MIRIFIGYDPREAVAFSVLTHSLQSLSSRPLSIAPLMLSQLKDSLWRPRDPLQSTDFSFSRFLTPYLCGFEGWAMFMDCDMLALDDVARLWELRDDNYAVMCVKHDHRPKEETKFLGEKQTKYEKKNWSSVMLFNCARCTALTPEYVNSASGLALHRFEWLGDDGLIGALPRRWNHLVGYDPESEPASIAHFTIGGPYFPEWEHCRFGDEWRSARDGMLAVASRQAKT